MLNQKISGTFGIAKKQTLRDFLYVIDENNLQDKEEQSQVVWVFIYAIDKRNLQAKEKQSQTRSSRKCRLFPALTEHRLSGGPDTPWEDPKDLTANLRARQRSEGFCNEPNSPAIVPRNLGGSSADIW
jgi:hypothetical protein